MISWFRSKGESFFSAPWWVKSHGTAKAALRYIVEADPPLEVSSDVVRDLAVLAYAEDQGWKVRQPVAATRP